MCIRDRRWNIEVYHRTLKSGCRVEDRQLGGADQLESCLAVDMVVAWRVFYLTKLGRETPAVPCTVYFEEPEWKALVAFTTQCAAPPPEPPSLWVARLMVATFGGWLGRKCYGVACSGWMTLWRCTKCLRGDRRSRARLRCSAILTMGKN